MEYRKILVPIDGSPESKSALQQAIYLAGISGAELSLLNVVDLNRQISAFEQVSTGGYVPGELKEKGYARLAECMHEVPREIWAKTIVVVGAPTDMIVETAEQGGFDLVVMGSRGRGAIETLVMGGVSQYVLHHAACPVMIVR